MLYPHQATPERPSAYAEKPVAKRAAISAKNAQRYRERKPKPEGEFDPNLTKPVRFTPAPTGLHPAERERLHAELRCLRREHQATQHGIDYLLNQLGLL